jgi:hypothetical protein
MQTILETLLSPENVNVTRRTLSLKAPSSLLHRARTLLREMGRRIAGFVK